MKRMAAALRSAEPGFPVLLPFLPALIAVLLALSWEYVFLTLRRSPAPNPPRVGFHEDCLLGMAVAVAGIVWAGLRGVNRVSGWTGTGLAVACYGLFARVTLHTSLLMLPPGSEPTTDPRFEPIIQRTHTIGTAAVVLGIFLAITACIGDWRERRARSRIPSEWLDAF